MEPFLKLVAKDLYSRFGDNLSDITLVFPSHRSTLFFQKYLSELIPKPIWLPKSTSVSNLMYEVSEFTPVDNIKLVFDLYRIYCEQMGTIESFDNFYYWGNVMIADFDQIDKFRVNPDDLFANIKSLKDIEERFGTFTDDQLESIRSFFVSLQDSNTKIKEKYYRIWGKLGSIYNQLSEHSLRKKTSYEGFAFRIAAGKLDQEQYQFTDGQIVFIGFNALNACEKSLFRYTKTVHNALYYWDYDRYYTDNDWHEAGSFIRENITEFPNALKVEVFDNFNAGKKIHIVSVPTNLLQAKCIPQVLDGFENSIEEVGINTAIILPQENLLLPVLSSIPAKVGKVNVTMSYPLKDSLAYTLSESLIKLQITAKPGKDSQPRFYHKDVFAVLNHPYIGFLEKGNLVSIKNNTTNNSIGLFTKQDLSRSELLNLIFDYCKTAKELNQYLVHIFNHIASAFSQLDENDKRTELEFIYVVYQTLNRIGTSLISEDIEISLKLYQQLFRKILLQQRVSFNGEPLEGLQVMGFLETRTLDFENLIVLSTNDEVLPGKNYHPSFITSSLRYAYQLPDIKHLESIYSYYFFRLIQRAKNIYLLYSDKAEGISSGELSRYAVELKYEKPDLIQNAEVKLDIKISEHFPVEVTKNDKVFEKLNRYLADSGFNNYLSPSAISNYIICPLRFYYRSIAELKEPEEIMEELDMPEFGKVIHDSIQLFYERLNKTYIEKVDLEKVMNDVSLFDNLILESFYGLKGIPKDSENSINGRTYLALAQAKYLLMKMVKLDMKRAPFELEGHELEVKSRIDFRQGEDILSIKVGGRLDRLEQRHGIFTVVDYKTGSFKGKGSFKSIEDLFNENHRDYKEIFQVLLYCHLLQKERNLKDITPQLWYVRDHRTNYLPCVKFNGELVESFTPLAAEFENFLIKLLSEIYNPELPFLPTKDVKSCINCPYSRICGVV